MTNPKALVGTQLGPWQLERLLGKGAMGAVFEATQGELRSALKVVLTGAGASESERQRFVREAKAVARIRSDYVCGSLGHGEDKGLQWLALEFVAGRDLFEVLKLRGKLSTDEALDYARQLLLGLTHAHAAGVVHRDLKPANAILTAEGRVKLVDFGLARRDDESMLLTAEGAIMGTPYYMSPEQVEGRVVDARADLYSLGHVIYHFFVGKPAYTGRNAGQILSAHLTRTMPSVQRVRRDTPAGLDRYLRKLSDVKLIRRFQTAQEALDAFDDVLKRGGRRGGDEVGSDVDEVPGPRPSAGFGVLSETLFEQEAVEATHDPGGPSPNADPGPKADAAKDSALYAKTQAPSEASWAPPTDSAAPQPDESVTSSETLLEAPSVSAPTIGSGKADSTLPALPLALVAGAAAAVGTALAVELLGVTSPAQRIGAIALAGLFVFEATRRWAQGKNLAAQRAQRFSVAAVRGPSTYVAAANQGSFLDRQKAQRLEQAGEYVGAAELYSELGEHREAARLFERSGRYDEAARVRVGMGQHLKAADLLVQGRDPLGAARMLSERAAELEALRKHEQRPRSQARLDGELAKIAERASALFRDEGELREAARLLGRTGRHHDAADLYLEAGAREEASQELIKAGDHERAAQLYERAGDVVAAARLSVPELLRKGDKAGAARAYEEVGDLERAARYYEEAGKLDRAADLLERLDKVERAAELFERCGKHVRAAELFERARDPFRAGRAFEQAGRPDDALQSYYAVDQGQKQWGQAMRRIARLEDGGATLRPQPEARPDKGGATLWEGAHESAAALAASTARPESDELDEGGATLWNQAPAEGTAPAVGATVVGASAEELDPDATYAGASAGGGDETLIPGGESSAPPPRRPSARPSGRRPTQAHAPDRPPRGRVAPSSARQAPPSGRAPTKGRPPHPERGRPSQRPARPARPTRSAGAPPRPSDRQPSAAPPPAEPRRWIGQVVDRYRVRDHLGSGAFADVFRAEHVHLERPVALKILRPELAARDEIAERFLAEAKVVSRIRHPGVVEVYDFGRAEGSPFMALELIEGQNLRDLIREGPQPIEQVRSLGRDLCDALGAAHAAGVIHRDLKPENVLVDREGRAHVLDFGMARVFWGTTRDEGAGFLGTPRYASPEAAAEGDVAAPADQYALGLILYELATGQLPFSSSSSVGWLHHHRSTRPRPPRELRPDLPRDLEASLLRALAKTPFERHADLHAFADSLS